MHRMDQLPLIAVMDFTLHQLAVFRAVARHSSYTRAAAELHISQPAVSRQVHLLEDALGVALFERIGRRVRLTDAGGDVLAYAQRVGSLVDELEAVLSERGQLRRGSLRLIGTSTAGEYLLPPLVADFRRAHPGISVSLRVANREHVLAALANGEVDLAVMGRPPARSDWDSVRILPNELVAIAPPRHPLTSVADIQPAQLVGETFFLRESGSGTRLATEDFLRQAGVSLNDAVELGSDSAIKQAVMAGLGLAILSRQAVRLELEVGRLALLWIQGLPLERHWFLVCPSERRAVPTVVAFEQLVKHAVQVAKATAREPASDAARAGQS
jgi:LysR family transcriptional regulator, low CO2-responsive transcriptional regulator